MKILKIIACAVLCLFVYQVFGELKIVTANVNLMPKGLHFATSGKADKRALDISDALLKQHPNTNVYFLQELYDEPASAKLIQNMQQAGFDYYPGPNKQQLQKYWQEQAYLYPQDKAKDSGQAIFVRKGTGLKVESYDVLAYCNCGIEGIGVLETYVPKGVVHIKLSGDNGKQPISIFGYHLQAEIGLFGLAYCLQGKWSKLPQTMLSDTIHLQPSQSLRDKYPNYLEKIRAQQVQATKEWIDRLRGQGKVAGKQVHTGDFNLIAGTREYQNLLTKLSLVPATDRTDLVTIGNQENTTWGRFTKPAYRLACRYVNNYGWMDLMLVDLKNDLGQSVTDHESVSMTLHND